MLCPGSECVTSAPSWRFCLSLGHLMRDDVVSLMSVFLLQMFVDNFQTAKEALSAATAQAAEKAASSVRGLAQKSFRLSMDIKLKAPLIIVPQSSTSHNAVVVDLGLITVGNSFSLLPAEGFSLPAVVEKMEVKLTQLKLSRYQKTLTVNHLHSVHEHSVRAENPATPLYRQYAGKKND